MADALDFTAKQTILIVDDTPENLALMNGLLLDHYRTKIANNGESALRVAVTHPLPDLILLKPGKLRPEEFEIMKTHTTLGRDAIAAAEIRLETPSSFLRYARAIAYGHREKWDGSGYPEGLAGERIPVCARLMAVADVYDALIGKRVYKPAFSHERAVEIMREGRGTHFDPAILDAFLEIAEDFRRIARQLADTDSETSGTALA